MQNDIYSISNDEVALDEKAVQLRMCELDLRQEIIDYLREINQRKLWRDWGFKSLKEFCQVELSYDAYVTREILIELGLVLPEALMTSNDHQVQSRILRLRDWRTRTALLENASPFIVLTNRCLLEIAQLNPSTIDHLGKIKGVGPKKLLKYGNAILKELQLLN